ncbi:ameloblastin [Spea bombifrons]|uniref:ameloblastin n=1 Tax=Spea bombifrons TaxID=233779 RepID=UPI00234A2830|nr:ameloblastin [Spea bombifrons]
MEEILLTLCLLGSVIAYPMQPQVPGTHGLASVSLESMRNLQAANQLTALPQLSRFGYNDPYSVLWLHGLLPPHSSYPWLHQQPQLLDNQQFEYALPIHPPPLPGAQAPPQPQNPTQDAQNVPQEPPSPPSKAEQLLHQPFLPMGFPNLQQADSTLTPQRETPADGQIQTVALYMYQTIMNKLLQQGAGGETVPDLGIPAAVPGVQQQQPYPGLVFMQYGGGAGGPPARLGVMSSEEMQGSHVGAAHAFKAFYPGVLGMGPGLPQNPALQGDFTVEDDSPAAGGKPMGQGAAQGPIGSPTAVSLNPPVPGLEGNPTGQGEAMVFPNINVPNSAFSPLGQSKFSPDVTPPNAIQLNHDTGVGFSPYGDETIPYGFQKEPAMNMEVTPANNAIDTPILPNDVHLQNHYFQEP